MAHAAVISRPRKAQQHSKRNPQHPVEATCAELVTVSSPTGREENF